MKKLINPWKGEDGYNCFGCSPDNEYGVKMEFYEDGDEIISIWKPQSQYQGWIDTLHGGIQALLLDEISGWTVFRKMQVSGVTSKMETRYLKPIKTTSPYVVIKAKIVAIKRNLVDVEANIFNDNDELCTKALCTYFTFSKEVSADKMHFKKCEVEPDEVLPLI